MDYVPYYFPPTSTPPLKRKGWDETLPWVFLGVVALHGLTAWFALTPSPTKPKSSTPQKVVVRTVQLQPKLDTMDSGSSIPVAAEIPKEIIPITAPQIEEPKQIAMESPPVEPKMEAPKEVVKEKTKAQPAPEPIKKVEAPKPETAKTPPKVSPKVQKPAAPVPAVKKEVPKTAVKKTPPPPPKPKPEVKKGPTPAETAAKEADLKKQKEIEAKAKEAEVARQKETAAKIAEAKIKQQAADEKLASSMKAFANLSQTRDKIDSSKVAKLDEAAIPRTLDSLQIEALPLGNNAPMEISYRDELAYRLKRALKMPDHGQVKVKLTLERSGKVASVKVESSESPKNKQYVEKTLPTLIFPPFGDRFEGVSQYTFMITLNNE